MKLKMFTDGGARGNPGPAAGGAVIYNSQNKILFSGGKYLGETTNNVAEYGALIFGLEKAQELGGTEIECKLDSELLVKQLNGEYKVRDENLAKLFMKVYSLQMKFKKITFQHIYREKNSAADAIVNKILDEK